MSLTITNPMHYHMVSQLSKAQSGLEKTQQQIATGQRVLSPSETIRMSRTEAQLRGNAVAERNIQDGISLSQYTESAVSSLNDMGQRLRELSVQYHSDILTDSDKNAIKTEAKSLTEEMTKIMSETKFNGKPVFNVPAVTIQTGANQGESLSLKLPLFSNATQVEGNVKPQEVVQQFKTTAYDKKTYLIETPFTLSSNGKAEKINATLTVNEKEGVASNTLSVKAGNDTYTGKLTFIDEKQGTWDITIAGDKYSGTFKTSGENSRKNMTGTTDFTLTSVYGNTSFTTKTTLANTEHVTEKVPLATPQPPQSTSSTFTLSQIGSANVEMVLNTDFVDKYVLNPISEARSSIGIQQNILEKRLDRQTNLEDQHQSQFSSIRDADVAQLIMKQTQQEMLVQVNATLQAQSRNFNRSMILELLR